MTELLYIFFGAESEYVLNPVFTEMQKRGYDCVELHAVPGYSIAAGLAAVEASDRPKVLITSAHFCWDANYMMSSMEVPDCPSLVEVFARLKPIFTAYYSHDLSQPLLTDEAAKIAMFDLYLAPTSYEHMFAGYTEVRTVGWIKAPGDLNASYERWGRGLWLTMSLEYILVEVGTTKLLGQMQDWLRDWLWIKFAPFPQFEEVESILRERGYNVIDRNVTPPIAARHFDFVVTNGESSVVRESALMGVSTYIVTNIGLFADSSRRHLWQFADLENVHFVPNLESIPETPPKLPPAMIPFDMDAAIDAITTGARRKTAS